MKAISDIISTFEMLFYGLNMITRKILFSGDEL